MNKILNWILRVTCGLIIMVGCFSIGVIYSYELSIVWRIVMFTICWLLLDVYGWLRYKAQ